MGILDSKSRILDALITAEGRRQMAEGTFVVSYATFTDSAIVYEPSEDEGHVDPTDKVYFESYSLPQDQVIFEANDTGKLVPLRDKQIILDRTDLSLLPGKFVFSLTDGKPQAFQINFGPKIKVGSIPYGFKETGVGFSYTDSNNSKTSIILDPKIQAGASSGSLPSEYYVGVKGGISAYELATNIQEVIEIASDLSGPDVEAIDKQDFIYFTDISGSHEKVKLALLTGTMFNLTSSSPPLSALPFVVNEAVIGGRNDLIDVPAAIFATDIAPSILSESFSNYQGLRCLATIDPFFQENKFTLSTSSIDFDISSFDKKIKNTISQVPTLNSIDSIFNDDRFSNLDNFRYLPPIVNTSDSIAPDKSNVDFLKSLNVILANYPPLGDNKLKLTHSQLLNELNDYKEQKISFIETTRQNNILCQIFEVNKLGEVRKLDIVEFGDSRDENPSDLLNDRVYFVGKTFTDDRGTTCYVNMFTLILSQTEGQEA